MRAGLGDPRGLRQCRSGSYWQPVASLAVFGPVVVVSEWLSDAFAASEDSVVPGLLPPEPVPDRSTFVLGGAPLLMQGAVGAVPLGLVLKVCARAGAVARATAAVASRRRFMRDPLCCDVVLEAISPRKQAPFPRSFFVLGRAGPETGNQPLEPEAD
jgi:hypothetical protein